MRRWPIWAAAAVVSFAAARPPVITAGTWDDWNGCLGRGGASATIESCTRAIATGFGGDAGQSVMFNNRGVAYLHGRRFAEAISDFGEAIRRRPESAAAYVNRAIGYVTLSQFQLALADFNTALRLDAHARGAHASRAGVYLTLGFNRLALGDLNSAIGEKPGDAQLLTERCEAKARLKVDLHRALEDCNKALRLKPHDAEALHARGLAETDLSRFDLAVKDYSEALAHVPTAEDVLLDRGNAYVVLRQYDRANADYNGALGLVPGDVAARDGLCWIGALTATDLDAARAYCSDILRASPADEHALDSRGFIELRMARYPDAMTDYQARLKLAATSASSLYGRGVAKSHLHDPDGSSVDISRAIALDPGVAQPYAELGLVPDEFSSLGLRPAD